MFFSEQASQLQACCCILVASPSEPGRINSVLCHVIDMSQSTVKTVNYPWNNYVRLHCLRLKIKLFAFVMASSMAIISQANDECACVMYL